ERNRFSLQHAERSEPSSPPATFPAPAPAPDGQLNAFQLGQRNACDQLAGNRYDPSWPRQFSGVSFRELQNRAQQAIATCQQAMSAIPDEPRMKYQLARAFQAANDNERAFALLSEL